MCVFNFRFWRKIFPHQAHLSRPPFFFFQFLAFILIVGSFSSVYEADANLFLKLYIFYFASSIFHKVSRIQKDWQKCEVCKPSESKMAARFNPTNCLRSQYWATNIAALPPLSHSSEKMLNWGIESGAEHSQYFTLVLFFRCQHQNFFEIILNNIFTVSRSTCMKRIWISRHQPRIEWNSN